MSEAGAVGRGGDAVEVVAFTLGKSGFLAAREVVRAFRHSPRVRHARSGRLSASELPVVSLSAVLGLGRDTATDRRVLEVMHDGEPLGLEVTSILGVRTLRVSALVPLPGLVQRNAFSEALLGVARLEGRFFLALDLPALLVERGVTAPDASGTSGLPAGAVDASSLPDGPPVDPFA